MKLLKNGLFGAVLLVLFSGCATQKSWVYKPAAYTHPKVVSTNTIVVLPFSDQRAAENDNKLMMYMIPFMPFGWADMNAPEGVPMHITSGMWMNYRPTEDFASALASEINSAAFVREAYTGNRKTDGTYYVQGKILNTRYKGKIYSYGFSVYGPLLWIIGLPAGSFSNELSVQLSCFDSQTGQAVFSKTYSAAPKGKVFFLYGMDSDFNYAEMLQPMYRQFVTEISKTVK